MEDNSITPNQSSVHDPNSLEAPAQSQSVADLAGLQKDYPIETLEVRSEGDKSPATKKVEYVPTVRSVPFSKRKAVLISLGITLVVVVLTGVSLGYLVRENAMDKNSIERNIPTQGVSMGDQGVGSSLPQFNSDQPSLLVDGDIITRGELKVSSGNFMTVIRAQNPTADQVINIPAVSGELCLSTNNCSYASLNDLTEVQGSIVAPTTLNSQDGEVTIQGASNRINVTTTGSVITITTPQALNTAANVQFANLTLSSQLKVNSISVNNGDLVVSAANGSIRFIDGDRTFRFPAGGLADQTICTTQNNCNYGTGNGDIVNGGQIGPIIIGTNDASSLSLYTNGIARLNIQPNGNLAIDTNTLFVDAVNNRVGIGTTTPAESLSVNGNAKISSNLQIGNSTAPPGQCFTLSGFVNCSVALRIDMNSTETSSRTYGNISNINLSPTSGPNGATNIGSFIDFNLRGNQNFTGTNQGMNIQATSRTSGVVSSLTGLNASVYSQAGSNIVNATAINATIGNILMTGTIQNATGISVSSISAGSIQNAVGMQIAGQTAGTNANVGLMIHESSTASLILAGMSGSPSSGIFFGIPGLGGTANLYLSSGGALATNANLVIQGTGTNTIAGSTNFDSNTLYVDSLNNRVGVSNASPSTALDVTGSVNVSDKLQVGATESISQCSSVIGPITCDFGLKVYNSSSEALNASFGVVNNLVMPGTNNNATENSASHNSIAVAGHGTFIGSQIGVHGTSVYAGTGSVANLVGVSGRANVLEMATGVVTSVAGLQGSTSIGSVGSIGTAYGLNILSASTNGGVISNNYGIAIQSQTAGASNYGVAIGSASTQTLWLQGNGGTANTGIGFGSARDTNLYRSASGILKTDGKLIVGDNTKPLFFGELYGSGPIESPNLLVNLNTTSPNFQVGSYTQLNLDPSVLSAGGIGGALSVTSEATSTGDITQMIGGAIGVAHLGGGTLSHAVGQQTGLLNAGAGLISDATGLYVAVQNTGSGSITNADGLYIDTVNATADAYGIRINGISAGTNNYGIAIGNASTQTLWLQGDSGTANTGIGFGSARDTNLYRSSTNTLRTDGSLQVSGNMSIGSLATIDNDIALNIREEFSSINVANSAIGGNLIINPGANTLGGGIAISGSAETEASNPFDIGMLVSVAGYSVHKGFGNLSRLHGLGVLVENSGSGSVSMASGLYVQAAGGGGVSNIVDNYGVLVESQSGAQNNYGIAIGEASTQTLWLQGDSGTANTGIGFGSARDTNLYRSAANVLRTDDSFIVGADLTVGGAVQLNSTLEVAGAVTLSGNLTVVNATVNGVLLVNGSLELNGHVISGNSSGSTTVSAGLGSECGDTAIVTIDGNDTAGTVNITTGAGACSPGELATITFANTYGEGPKVTLTPANAAAASLQYYSGSATTTGVSIDSASAPAPATNYLYNYQIIQ